MAQYINKDAVIAEIERLRKNQRLDDRHGQGVLDGLYAIERFLDTLEVKELNMCKAEPVSEDLEEEITRYFSKNPIKYLTDWPALKNTALHFANWQKEQMLKDAVEGISYFSDYGKTMTIRSEKPIRGCYHAGKIKLIIIKED